MKKIKIGAAIALLSGTLVTHVLTHMKTRNVMISDISNLLTDPEFDAWANTETRRIQNAIISFANGVKVNTEGERRNLFRLYDKIVQKTGIKSDWFAD